MGWDGTPIPFKWAASIITIEFLREIESHIVACYQGYVIRCYGITRDPESNNFMMVVQYAENGNLRQRLNNSFNSMNWEEKLDILKRTASGLENIHDKGLIHHDFHCADELRTSLTLLLSHSIYTSRLLDFKNLPEQKNAIDSNNDDNSFEYLESIEAIDFTT
ncbi:kinase-like domain-containing protein [Rhizophagus irregularis DAOM 181602=DAOM 197198]|nr:kinase-like domain-containing protein [Rhizophagus irregularis DAOM 181602=DAOM 197198]